MTPTILHFADNKFSRGATVRFANGEPCTVSFSRLSGVRVKRSRFGFFGTTLYEETDLYLIAKTTGALAYLFQARKFPDGISNPSLCAFFNAILHCASPGEVCRVLHEAVATAERKAGCSIGDIAASDLPAWVRPQGPISNAGA